MGEFDDIRDDVADKLAEKLGIHQWYSLHMMDMCMGTYTPEAHRGGCEAKREQLYAHEGNVYVGPFAHPRRSAIATVADFPLCRSLRPDL